MPSYFPKWVLDIESQNSSFKKNQEKAEGLLVKLGDFWWNELSFHCSWDGSSWKEPIEFLNLEPWLSVDSMPGAGLGFGTLKVYRDIQSLSLELMVCSPVMALRVILVWAEVMGMWNEVMCGKGLRVPDRGSQCYICHFRHEENFGLWLETQVWGISQSECVKLAAVSLAFASSPLLFLVQSDSPWIINSSCYHSAI